MNELSEIYRERFQKTGLARRDAVWKVLCQKYFNKRIPQNATIVDLACGYGEFINNIDCKNKYAIDLNPDAKKFLNSDVKLVISPATELDKIGLELADVVFTSNFLEHLKDKSECSSVLESVYRVLKPGGMFIILGPNMKYAYKEYWDYYDHYLPLTHLSLAEGLKLAGFRIKENIPRFLPYTMNNKTPTHDILIEAYLSLPIAWSLFGKQFLVTAIK